MQISCAEIHSIPSERCNEQCAFLKGYLDRGISRSLIFCGLPGVGKTTLAQTIINQLDFRTLKFKYQTGLNFSLMQFIIEVFKIDAVIIDDFDQVGDSVQMLEFLEIIKRKTKLVIGLANSLKKFHPAILRPGRFDQIVRVDCLEEQTIRDIMGDLYSSYGQKVKKWPVAFINELCIRHEVNPDQLENDYTELNTRVLKQLADLSDKEGGAEDAPEAADDENAEPT